MHEADVVDAPAEHGEPVEAHAEGEALVFCRVDARVLEHIGMHHASAHHFNPLAAEFFGDVFAVDARVDFDARLDERKEAWTKTHFDIRAFEKLGIKTVDRALEIRE